MISITITVTALILSGATVTLQSNDGNSHSGSLVQLDQQLAVVQTDQGLQTVPRDQLLRISNSDSSTANAEPTLTVTLTDGTQIGATTFELGDKANIGLVGGATLEIDPRNLQTVRFQQPGVTGPLNKQWIEFTTGDHEGDLLIVRKADQSLSYLEGAIRGVTKHNVDFVYDGDGFQVAREKVEGLKFLTRQVEKARASQIVHATGACLFQARSVGWTENGFDVELVCGDKVRLPNSVVRLVDYAASRVVYLSALEPYKLTVTPRLPTSTLGDLANRLIYKPGINISLSGRRLSLPSGKGGAPRQYFDQGLAIHSRTELIYRLDDGDYERLQGIAGLDPDLKQQGTVHLAIAGDDQPLLEQELGPNDPPLPIDVKIAGVRRLRILVDYGDKLDVADHLHLCDIRLTP